MNNAIKISRRDASPILNVLGSDYKGRTFSVTVAERHTVHNYELAWDGGSKKDVTYLRLVGGEWQVVEAASTMPGMYQSVASQTLTIDRDVIVAERSWFCGKDMGYRFTVCPGSDFLPRAIAA